MIPTGAAAIIKAREQKKRPAAMVIVADGPVGLSKRFPTNPVLGLRVDVPVETYDFRCLANLEVEIATKGDPTRSLRIIRAVLAQRPEYLRLWLVQPNITLCVHELAVTNVYRDRRPQLDEEGAFAPETEIARERVACVVRWYRERIRSTAGYPT